jgi:hypothetical protein
MEKIQVTIPLKSGFTDIFFNLAGQGINQIIVRYSGEGDDGAIYEVVACKMSNEFEISKSLRERIEEHVYTNLLTRLSDWRNNEGGGGELIIETADASYNCEHYTNFEPDGIDWENMTDDERDNYEIEYKRNYESHEGKFGN